MNVKLITLAGFLGNFFGSGENDEKVIEVLKNYSNYLHPVDMFGHIINQAKWGLIRLFYGFAKWASEITDKAFGAKGLIDPNGEIFGLQGKYIQYVVWSLMILTLTYLGVKMAISKNPPQIKNIFIQLLVTIFLILNIGTVTREISKLGTLGYQTATGSSLDNTGADIPFELIKSNTNDTLYMLKKDFKFDKVEAGGTTEKFGNNILKSSDFESGKMDMSMDLTPTLLDDVKDAPGYKNNKVVKPEDLKMKLTTIVDDNGNNSYAAEKIGGVSIPFVKIYEGGYERFPVATLPTIIGLIALTVAFLFAAFVIIKSFLDLAIMQIIGVLVASTDLETGDKTKKVIESLFQAAITIAFTGIELAFYKVAISYFSSIGTDPWVFVIMILAATMMLITGSEKTAMFFGVDTGAQKGWRAVAQTAYMGSQIARGTKSLAHGIKSVPGKVGDGIKKMANSPSNIKAIPARMAQKVQDFKDDVKESKSNADDDIKRAKVGAGSVQAQRAREERQQQRESLSPTPISEVGGFDKIQASNPNPTEEYITDTEMTQNPAGISPDFEFTEQTLNSQATPKPSSSPNSPTIMSNVDKTVSKKPAPTTPKTESKNPSPQGRKNRVKPKNNPKKPSIKPAKSMYKKDISKSNNKGNGDK